MEYEYKQLQTDHFFVDPNKNLWLAVILRLIDDASEHQITVEGGNTGPAHTKLAKVRMRDTARFWLFELKAGGLELICEMLGLSPSWVRMIAKRRVEMTEERI